jgi:hypothetical protein
MISMSWRFGAETFARFGMVVYYVSSADVFSNSASTGGPVVCFGAVPPHSGSERSAGPRTFPKSFFLIAIRLRREFAYAFGYPIPPRSAKGWDKFDLTPNWPCPASIDRPLLETAGHYFNEGARFRHSRRRTPRARERSI